MLSRKKIGAAALTLALSGTVVAFAGCTSADTADVSQASNGGADEQLYLPKVQVKEDGTRIQRTPSEGVVDTSLDTSYSYHTPEPENMVPYNTYYLKADDKGCNSCHDDLAKTLEDSPFLHVVLSNNLGLETTVQQCIDCHTFGYGYQANQRSFGSLIHGIHDVNGAATANSADGAGSRIDCWSCHVATGDGSGMQLWDEVKHSQLRGITAVPEVEADEFTWDQDTTVAPEDIFDFNWQYFDLDYVRYHNELDGVPLDQEMFNDWTITVSGDVDTEITYTLPELIEKYGGVKIPLTYHCTYNPTGGPLISNSVYTCIPISKLLKEAGMHDDAVGIAPMSPDGNSNPYTLATSPEAYIIYEIDGQPLPWKQGYPCQLIVPHTGAPSCNKEVSDLIVMNAEDMADVHEWNGWPAETDGGGDYYTVGNWPDNDSNGYMNKPNVGIFNFPEGTIVKTGEPITVSGYADAWNKNIVAMEFSMDGGVTWTRYETPGANLDNWVNWHFTWTPEDTSAYVLSVRSVDETGTATPEPIEVLFNAHEGGM